MATADADRVAELLATAGVEERVELRGRLGFLAFHGGLEGGTEETAEAAASASDASLYVLVQPPTLRWHLPSHVIGAGASPALRGFLAHIDVAIALHGFGRRFPLRGRFLEFHLDTAPQHCATGLAAIKPPDSGHALEASYLLLFGKRWRDRIMKADLAPACRRQI